MGRFEGGSTVNSIAQEASILYEFRSTSQRALEIMERDFRQAVDTCQNRGGALTVDLLGIRPGNGQLDPATLANFTERSAEVIRRYYDGDLDFAAYSTDSNIPLSLGIPANTIGTVIGQGAHTREEWIDKNSIESGLKIVLTLMLNYRTTKCQ